MFTFVEKSTVWPFWIFKIAAIKYIFGRMSASDHP